LIKLELNTFAKKTKEEKDEFLNNVKSICLYNQKLFLEYAKSVNKPLKDNPEMKKMIKFLIGDNLI
jgi:translation elongation factor EF-Ts